MLIEAPVATQRNEASAIHVDTQRVLSIDIRHLAQPRLVGQRRTAIETVAGIIEELLSVAIRPPKVEITARKLGENIWRESYLLLCIGRQRDRFFELHIADVTTQCACDRLDVIVSHKHRWSEANLILYLCTDVWIADGDHARRSQINLVPDARLTASDGGNPVPAYSSMEGRIISSEDTAIKLC